MTVTRRSRHAVGALTLRVARSRFGGRLAQIVCAHAPALLPAVRVLDSGQALVIAHPLPEFPGHLVIVPRTRIRSLCELVARRRADVFRDLLAAARLAAPLAGEDVLLSISVGGRQQVDQLHAHLIPVRRAGMLLEGTVSRARLPLDDAARMLAALGAVAHATGDCNRAVEGSLLLLGFTGPTPELRATRADARGAPAGGAA